MGNQQQAVIDDPGAISPSSAPRGQVSAPPPVIGPVRGTLPPPTQSGTASPSYSVPDPTMTAPPMPSQSPPPTQLDAGPPTYQPPVSMVTPVGFIPEASDNIGVREQYAPQIQQDLEQGRYMAQANYRNAGLAIREQNAAREMDAQALRERDRQDALDAKAKKDAQIQDFESKGIQYDKATGNPILDSNGKPMFKKDTSGVLYPDSSGAVTTPYGTTHQNTDPSMAYIAKRDEQGNVSLEDADKKSKWETWDAPAKPVIDPLTGQAVIDPETGEAKTQPGETMLLRKNQFTPWDYRSLQNGANSNDPELQELAGKTMLSQDKEAAKAQFLEAKNQIAQSEQALRDKGILDESTTGQKVPALLQQTLAGYQETLKNGPPKPTEPWSLGPISLGGGQIDPEAMQAYNEAKQKAPLIQAHLDLLQQRQDAGQKLGELGAYKSGADYLQKKKSVDDAQNAAVDAAYAKAGLAPDQIKAAKAGLAASMTGLSALDTANNVEGILSDPANNAANQPPTLHPDDPNSISGLVSGAYDKQGSQSAQASQADQDTGTTPFEKAGGMGLLGMTPWGRNLQVKSASQALNAVGTLVKSLGTLGSAPYNLADAASGAALDAVGLNGGTVGKLRQTADYLRNPIPGLLEKAGTWMQGFAAARGQGNAKYQDDTLTKIVSGGARMAPMALGGTVSAPVELTSWGADGYQSAKDESAKAGDSALVQNAKGLVEAVTMMGGSKLLDGWGMPASKLNPVLWGKQVAKDATTTPILNLLKSGAGATTADMLKRLAQFALHGSVTGGAFAVGGQVARGDNPFNPSDASANTKEDLQSAGIMAGLSVLMGGFAHGLSLSKLSGKIDSIVAKANDSAQAKEPDAPKVTRADVIGNMIQTNQVARQQDAFRQLADQYSRIDSNAALSQSQRIAAKQNALGGLAPDVRAKVGATLDASMDAKGQLEALDKSTKAGLPPLNPKFAKWSDGELQARMATPPHPDDPLKYTPQEVQAEAAARTAHAQVDAQNAPAVHKIIVDHASRVARIEQAAKTPDGIALLDGINRHNAGLPAGAPKADLETAQLASDISPKTEPNANIQPHTLGYLPVAHDVEGISDPNDRAFAKNALKMVNGREHDPNAVATHDPDEVDRAHGEAVKASEKAAKEGQNVPVPPKPHPDMFDARKTPEGHTVLTDRGLQRLRRLVPSARGMLEKDGMPVTSQHLAERGGKLDEKSQPKPDKKLVGRSAKGSGKVGSTVRRVPHLAGIEDGMLATRLSNLQKGRDRLQTAIDAQTKATGNAPEALLAHAHGYDRAIAEHEQEIEARAAQREPPKTEAKSDISPSDRYWTATGDRGTDVRVPAESYPDRAGAAQALRSKLKPGELLHDNDVYPPEDHAEAPTTAPEASSPAVESTGKPAASEPVSAEQGSVQQGATTPEHVEYDENGVKVPTVQDVHREATKLTASLDNLNLGRGLKGKRAIGIEMTSDPKVTIRTTLGADGKITVEINPEKAQAEMDHRRQQDGGDPRKWLADALNEELTHVADQLAAREKWEAAGSKGSAVDYWHEERRKNLASIKTAIAGGDKTVARAFVQAFHNYANVGKGISDEDFAQRTGDVSDENVVETATKLIEKIEGSANHLDVRSVSEFIRQMIQAKNEGTLTEAGYRAVVGKLIAWMKAVCENLQQAAHESPELAHILKPIEDLLKVAGDPGAKVFKPKTDEEIKQEEDAHKEALEALPKTLMQHAKEIARNIGIKPSDYDAQELKEGLNKGHLLGLIHKTGMSMDKFRQAINDRGFNFETPDALVQALIHKPDWIPDTQPGGLNAGARLTNNLFAKLDELRQDKSNDRHGIQADEPLQNRDVGQRSGTDRVGERGQANAGAAGSPRLTKRGPLSPKQALDALTSEGLKSVERGVNGSLIRASRDKHDADLIGQSGRAGMFIMPKKVNADIRSLGDDKGGAEHEAYLDAQKGSWSKITRPGKFGISADAHEYLTRLHNANSLWPELGYQVHGVTVKEGFPQIVTSMADFDGEEPSDAEVKSWLSDNGWKPIPGVYDGWQNAEGMRMYDTHTGNFLKVKTPDGSLKLVPIDSDVHMPNGMPDTQPGGTLEAGHSQYQDYARNKEEADADRVPVVRATKELSGLVDGFKNGQLNYDEFQGGIEDLARRMVGVKEAKESKRNSAELQRGADIVREKLINARRRGFIPHDQAELALWALSKNPELADNLAISIRKSDGGSAAGNYDPAGEIISIFKGNKNPNTAVHEILHHAERMMPREIQDPIAMEWAKAWSKAFGEATGAKKEALKNILLSQHSDTAPGQPMSRQQWEAANGREAYTGEHPDARFDEAYKAYVKNQSRPASELVNEAFRDGVLKYDDHYRLVNPSEYWAVNASRIMSSRFAAEHSWAGKAKQWLAEMLQKVRGLLGQKSDLQVLRGLHAVLSGNGEFQSKNMIAAATRYLDARDGNTQDFIEPDLFDRRSAGGGVNSSHEEAGAIGSRSSGVEPSEADSLHERAEGEARRIALTQRAANHLSETLNRFPPDQRDLLAHHFTAIHDDLKSRSEDEVRSLAKAQEPSAPLKGDDLAAALRGKRVNLVTAWDKVFANAKEGKARRDFFDQRLNANEIDADDLGRVRPTDHPIIDPNAEARSHYNFQESAPENEIAARSNNLGDKLEEAKLAGLHDPERLSDLGVHNPIQASDLDKLDARYGKNNWILKPSPREIGMGGSGVFFPETLRPALEGKEVSFKRGGYEVGESEALSQGKAQDAIDPQNYMAQRRLRIKGETPEKRENGVTIMPGEYRVHIWTDENGDAHVIKGATFDKNGVKALGTDTPELLSVEKAAKDRVMALPKKYRINSVFGPDIVSLEGGGHDAVELNPTFGKEIMSGWMDLPPAQDALVSGLRGETPLHRKFAQEQMGILSGGDGLNAGTRDTFDTEQAQPQETPGPKFPNKEAALKVYNKLTEIKREKALTAGQSAMLEAAEKALGQKFIEGGEGGAKAKSTARPTVNFGKPETGIKHELTEAPDMFGGKEGHGSLFAGTRKTQHLNNTYEPDRHTGQLSRIGNREADSGGNPSRVPEIGGGIRREDETARAGDRPPSSDSGQDAAGSLRRARGDQEGHAEAIRRDLGSAKEAFRATPSRGRFLREIASLKGLDQYQGSEGDVYGSKESGEAYKVYHNAPGKSHGLGVVDLTNIGDGLRINTNYNAGRDALAANLDSLKQIPGFVPFEVHGVSDRGNAITKMPFLEGEGTSESVRDWADKAKAVRLGEKAFSAGVRASGKHDNYVVIGKDSKPYLLADVRPQNFRTDANGRPYLVDAIPRELTQDDLDSHLILKKAVDEALAKSSGSSLQAGTRDIDPDDYEKLLSELQQGLPSQKEIDDLREQAMAEKPGEQTIGEPRLANPAHPKQERRTFDAIQHLHQQQLEEERQTHEQWNTEAYKRLENDPQEAKAKALKQALDPERYGNPTAVDVKTMQILTPQLMQEAYRTGDDKLKREAATLAFAYTYGGREQARAFAARFDPYKTPVQRNLEYLTKMMTVPTDEATLEHIASAPTPAERASRQMRAQTEWRQKMEKALADMGITPQDIFEDRARVSLKSAKFVQEAIGGVGDPRVKKAMRLFMDGAPLSSIERATGLSAAEVAQARKQFDANLEAKLGEYIRRGITPEQLEELDPAALFAGVAAPKHIDITPEEYQKRLQAMLRKIRPDYKDADEGRVTRDEQTGKLVRRRKTNAKSPNKEQAEHDRQNPFEWSKFDAGNKEQVARAARLMQAANGNKWEMVHEYWQNSILSGPQTHVAISLGQGLNALHEFMFKRPIEAAINAIIKDPNSPQRGELKHLYSGMMPGIARGWSQAMRTWRSGIDFTKSDMLNGQMEIKGTDFQGQGHVGVIPGKLGRAIRIPCRVIMAMDSFNKNLAGMMAVGAEAYRSGKALGFEGDDMAKHIDSEIKTPGSQSWQKAYDIATNQVGFHGEVPQYMKDVMKYRDLRGQHNLVEKMARMATAMLFPFVKVPYNLTRIGLRKSPLGILNVGGHIMNGAYSMAQGKPFVEGYSKVQQISDAAEQFLAWGATALLAGAVEGDSDDDKKTLLITAPRYYGVNKSGEVSALDRKFGGPTMIRVGGRNGIYINYGKFEPIAGVLGSLANIVRGLKDRPGNFAPDVMGGVVGQLKGNSFVQGMSTILDTIDAAAKGDTDGLGARWAEQFLQGFVPNIFRQPIRNLDDAVRDSKFAGPGYVMTQNPAFVNQAIDLYGRPETKTGIAPLRVLFQSGITPSPQLEMGDKFLTNYNRTADAPYWPDRPTTAQYSLMIGGKKVPMTTNQATAFDKIAGQLFKQKLNGWMTEEVADHPTEEFKKRFSEDLAEARKEAKLRIQTTVTR